VLRAEHVPEELFWVALAESGFDPTIRSSAGAAGLWQFMPEGARAYGLLVDRWIDERFDPTRSAEAAARYLSDLHRRFGTWELALAAYNMGSFGLLSAIHKYNTNDFWELSTLESGLPWETTLYVPKIIALAVVGRNPSAFGLDLVTPEPAVVYDEVELPGGVSLRAIATAAGAELSEIEALNPQLRAGRTPPRDRKQPDEQQRWTVRVPPGRGQDVTQKLGKLGLADQGLVPYVARLGDTLEAIAATRRTTRGRLAEINGVHGDEALRPGTVLLVPAGSFAPPAPAIMPAMASTDAPGPSVVVSPVEPSAVDGRGRIFYRVVPGDRLTEIAAAFRVSIEDLVRWNHIEPAARLHEGMTLQLFVAAGTDLSKMVYVRENEVRVLSVCSSDFFDYFEAFRGRKRETILVGEKDSWDKIAKRYKLSLGQLERINHRARSEKLTPGERLIVYRPIDQKASGTTASTAKMAAAAAAAGTRVSSGPTPLGPIVAPDPAVLPEIPDPASGG
jgi:membrane-bound lytic murein transglycosylase D